uniref:Cyanocobalamin reductase (cyanide-eliminating) n=2 Tax=Ascaris TaxID=6251 RepID=A0A0M3IMN9_ASCLU
MMNETGGPADVMDKLRRLFPDQEGFELHPFKVGSYNSVAGPCFQLPYKEDTLGIILLNTPHFFETTFKKWIQMKKKPEETLEDFAKHFPSGPLSAFFNERFEEAIQMFGAQEVVVIHDSEVLPNRRPKVLMTTCGHVAGAAFFYHPPEEALGTANSASSAKRRRAGVSLHPKYGGYFAFRGVFVFLNVRLPSDFKEERAPMLLDTVEKQEEAITLFNTHWWDGRYRDCGNPVEKYSDLQLKYFSTMPDKRWPVIAHWFE